MPESSILIAIEYVIHVCIQVTPLNLVFADNDGRMAYNYNATDHHQFYKVVLLN